MKERIDLGNSVFLEQTNDHFILTAEDGNGTVVSTVYLDEVVAVNLLSVLRSKL